MENPLIYSKIIEVMSKVPAIGKDKRNGQQGFNYRGIDDVMNTLQNILPSVGVFYVPEVVESIREERTTKSGGSMTYTVLKVKYTFYAADGSSISAVVQSEGMDSADKSSNKAMSGACKYALFQVFNIATQEMIDPDSESPEESRPAQKTQPAPAAAAPAAKKPFDEDAFLERFNGVKDPHTKFSAANAEIVLDSDEVPYGMIPTEELLYRLNALTAKIRKNGLTDDEKAKVMYKLGVIDAVLMDRKEHPEKRGGRASQ